MIVAKKEYEGYVREYSNKLKHSGKIIDGKNVLKVLDNLSNNKTYEGYQKKYALKYYFDSLILQNLDLKELLTNPSPSE